jgi:hypothetical protein
VKLYEFTYETKVDLTKNSDKDLLNILEHEAELQAWAPGYKYSAHFTGVTAENTYRYEVEVTGDWLPGECPIAAPPPTPIAPDLRQLKPEPSRLEVAAMVLSSFISDSSRNMSSDLECVEYAIKLADALIKAEKETRVADRLHHYEPVVRERPIAKNLHLRKDPAKKLDTFVLRDKFNREPNDIFAEARASASRRCEVAGWQLHDVTVDINTPDLDGERTNYYCEIWGWEE